MYEMQLSDIAPGRMQRIKSSGRDANPAAWTRIISYKLILKEERKMLFNLFGGKDINKGLEAYKAEDNAVLLDVRTKEEYSQFHIKGSVNIPLQNLERVGELIEDKSTPIFVHCQSGARSARAAHMLKNFGYRRVSDIGGLNTYNGRPQ